MTGTAGAPGAVDQSRLDQYVRIAKVCHEANRAYSETLGDRSQPAWEQAPDWQKGSALDGVQNIASGRVTKPSQSHESWLEEKRAAGWIYGPKKDPEAKVHPCMVPFGELPREQQMKDVLFFAVASALLIDYSRPL